MIVRLKKLSDNAVVPSYAKEGDACLDLTATDVYYDDYGNMICEIGLAIEIPEGYVGLIFPRSSIVRKVLDMANAVGVIDSGYRGPLRVVFKPAPAFKMENFTGDMGAFKTGDRVAQLMILPLPYITVELVDHLSETVRGDGGFGSTGE